MKYKYIYLLLFVLVLYYLLTNIVQKYSNETQKEDFDPSLVPVSSIVTLAKVAQKLVDGGGTLTNPGNLNIGIDSAPGNLTVTGTTTLKGPNTTVNGILGVNGASIFNSDVSVVGTVNAPLIVTDRIITSTDSKGSQGIQLFGKDHNNYYNSGTGNTHIFRGEGGEPTKGNVIVGNDLTVVNKLTVTGNEHKLSGKTSIIGDATKEKDPLLGVLSIEDKSGNSWAFTAGAKTEKPGIPPNALGILGYGSDKGGVRIADIGNNGDAAFYHNFTISKDAAVGNNLNVLKDTKITGKLCLGNTCMSEHTLNTFLFPKMTLIRSRYPNQDWLKSVVDDIYPIFFWDGGLDPEGIGYLIRPGLEIPNLNRDNLWDNQIWNPNWDYNASDRWDHLAVAPGYGVIIWDNINYKNDSGTADGKVFENKETTAKYYNLKDSNSVNSTNSLKTYKLLPTPEKI